MAVTASVGFIPTTADFFDEIGGLIAVGFVMFDTGVPYIGKLTGKLFFRIAGNFLGISWAFVAHYAAYAVRFFSFLLSLFSP